jgi:competence protein ComEA
MVGNELADAKRKLPWFNPGDRLALGVVCAVLIGLLGLHWVLGAGIGKTPPHLEGVERVDDHKIDINRADWWELQALQGIGEKRAKDIVAYRDRHGPFKSVDDLVDVKGIGPKMLLGLRSHLTAGGPEADDEGIP